MKDLEALARTIYGEARGESQRGREAVACVILNRVNADLHDDNKPDWWGEGVYDVCTKPWQFSCWLEDDPNREKIRTATTEDEVFCECLLVAVHALLGDLTDQTNGATHYHVTGLLAAWSRGHVPCVTIGKHVFFNDIK